uniref:LIM zinc-binding domain-containing protein n=1 Tax=Panagrolaimus davidi TaxID=227884 RepID=A0A914Q5M6_9BILA
MGPPAGNGANNSGGTSSSHHHQHNHQSKSTKQHQQQFLAATSNGVVGGGGSDDRRNCALCNSSLGEEAIVAMNRLWHPDHFLCNGCKKPIRQTFQAADNHAYCVHCFAERFNPKCAGCHEILIDTCLLALDKHWHPRCFTCNCCRRPLPNGEYYLVDDKPYDLDCHWEKRLDKRTQIAKERQNYPEF